MVYEMIVNPVINKSQVSITQKIKTTSKIIIKVIEKIIKNL